MNNVIVGCIFFYKTCNNNTVISFANICQTIMVIVSLYVCNGNAIDFGVSYFETTTALSVSKRSWPGQSTSCKNSISHISHSNYFRLIGVAYNTNKISITEIWIKMKNHDCLKTFVWQNSSSKWWLISQSIDTLSSLDNGVWYLHR